MLIRASEPRAPPCSARIRAFAPSSAPELVDVRPASSAGRRHAWGVAIIAPAAFGRALRAPAVRKNPGFGNPAPRLPLWKAPDLGFRRRDRGGGATAKWGKIAKSPIFHLTRTQNATARALPADCPDRKQGAEQSGVTRQRGVRTNVSREGKHSGCNAPRYTSLSQRSDGTQNAPGSLIFRSMRLRTEPRAFDHVGDGARVALASSALAASTMTRTTGSVPEGRSSTRPDRPAPLRQLRRRPAQPHCRPRRACRSRAR